MLYLAWHHLWFLAGAAGCGAVIGWLSVPPSTSGRRAAWPWILAALWLAALLASVIRLVNGWPAMLLETALIYLAVYAAGCWLGGLARRALDTSAPAVSAPVLALPPPAPVAIEALAPSLDEAVPTLPRADAPAIVVVPAPPSEALALAGERPPELAGPREGEPDDLKRIKGIGRGNEERLRGIGIWHLDQIAGWTPAHVEWVGGYLAFPGRIERENWVGQARRLTGQDEAREPDDAATPSERLSPERPHNALPEPRSGEPDRLTLLAGVGPGLADRLNRSGLWHFDQIAALRDQELADLLEALGTDRSIASSWREDADILAHGGETAHSRAVKSGRITPRD